MSFPLVPPVGFFKGHTGLAFTPSANDSVIITHIIIMYDVVLREIITFYYFRSLQMQSVHNKPIRAAFRYTLAELFVIRLYGFSQRASFFPLFFFPFSTLLNLLSFWLSLVISFAEPTWLIIHAHLFMPRFPSPLNIFFLNTHPFAILDISKNAQSHVILFASIILHFTRISAFFSLIPYHVDFFFFSYFNTIFYQYFI